MAARGSEGRAFPWGDREWVPERANLCDRQCFQSFPCPFGPVSTKVDDGFASTAPVDNYPAGRTPSGIADLLGNVDELTSTIAPGGSPEAVGTTQRVMLGSSWASNADITFRGQLSERVALPYVGFRCARDAQTERR
jgi:formylglycine-generating enzyme required for sulfatase activity